MAFAMASPMVSLLLLICVQDTTAFAFFYSQKCDTPMTVGTTVMGKTTLAETTYLRPVTFQRDGKPVACGSLYRPGEELTAHIAPTEVEETYNSRQEFAFSLIGGVFQDGGCGGSRISDSDGATLQAPTDGSAMTLVAAWPDIDLDNLATVKPHLRITSTCSLYLIEPSTTTIATTTTPASTTTLQLTTTLAATTTQVQSTSIAPSTSTTILRSTTIANLAKDTDVVISGQLSLSVAGSHDDADAFYSAVRAGVSTALNIDPELVGVQSLPAGADGVVLVTYEITNAPTVLTIAGIAAARDAIQYQVTLELESTNAGIKVLSVVAGAPVLGQRAITTTGVLVETSNSAIVTSPVAENDAEKTEEALSGTFGKKGGVLVTGVVLFLALQALAD